MKNINNKSNFLLKGIIAIIIFIICILIITFSRIYINSTRYSGETILIPNNYIGYIYIVYDDKDGLFLKDKGKMVYHIPKNGVYKTRLSISNRLNMFENNVEFYYFENGKKKKSIPYVLDLSSINTNLNKIMVKSLRPVNNLNIEGNFYSKPYRVYQIDSLKNFKTEAPPLTKEKYLNYKMD